MSDSKKNDLSKLGSLVVSPLKHKFQVAKHDCEQNLWKLKSVNKKPTTPEPEHSSFVEDRRGSTPVKLIIDNELQ